MFCNFDLHKMDVVRDTYVQQFGGGFKLFGRNVMMRCYANALDVQREPLVIDFVPLLTYSEWQKLDGFHDDPSGSLQGVSEALLAAYHESVKPETTDFKDAKSIDKLAERQSKFVRKLGYSVPTMVWVHKWANDLIGGTHRTLMVDMADMLNEETGEDYLSLVRGQTKSNPTRRDVAERKLTELEATSGQKVFLTDLCDALDNQEHLLVDNFEMLLDPEYWSNLLAEERDEKSDQDAESLSDLWQAKLKQLQADFLREQGHRIPKRVLPLTLAYEAMKEEKFHTDYQPRIKLLGVMGVNY
jgi:hypothetical protein